MNEPHSPSPQHTTDGGYAGMPKWVKLQILVIAIFVVGVIVFSVVYSAGGNRNPDKPVSAPTSDQPTAEFALESASGGR